METMEPPTTAAPAQNIPASGPTSCPTCGGAPAEGSSSAAQPQYVYALGDIVPRIPSLSIEKEFAQATGRSATEGLTDRQALCAVLSKPENRYLARQLCWVFTVEGLETYILVPRDPADVSSLIEALRANPNPADLDIVIGIRGPMAPPTMCNGLMVPIVAFDQIYSFDRDSLIASIPKPEKAKAPAHKAAAEELLDRILQLADNAGATDEHRALNYLAVRYAKVYDQVAQCHAANCSLSAVDVRPSTLGGIRKIVDVVFTFTNRNTDVLDKYFVRVDVTEEFPFLVTKLSPYYDR
jgi:hypothetical protein